MLVPLAEQNRALWDQDRIAEGVGLITAALQHSELGSYQLQAAIAAVHDEAAEAEATDWHQIVALYDLLEHNSDNPMITLNRAVAVAMANGPGAGLEVLGEVEADGRLGGHHRVEAVRGHLLELSGDASGARAAYREAAHLTTSIPERRYLEARAAALGDAVGPDLAG